MLGDGFSDVLSAAQAAQEWALERLYREYRPPVLKYFYAQQPRDADDLTSEVFLSVASSLDHFSGDEAGFRSWVFTIAHRRLSDHRRRWAQAQTDLLAPEQMDRLAPCGDGELDAMSRLGTRTALSRIAALPPAQAEVVLLRIVADLPAEQVGRIVGRRADAVRALQHRALQRLARDLQREAVAAS